MFLRINLIIRILTAVCGTISLLGCGALDFGINASDSGKLEGFIESYSSLSSSGVGGLSGCSNEKVFLYELTPAGEKGSLISEANVNSDGSFVFTGLSKLGLNFSVESSSTSHSIEFECGAKLYQRFVTGSEKQIISEGTTLMGWTLRTDASSRVHSQKPVVWKSFYESIESASSLTEAYSTIISNPSLTNKYIEAFGEAPTQLLEAPPEIITTTVPEVIPEGLGTQLSVQANHWSLSYDMAFLWRLNGSNLSQNSDFTYTPGGNSQGSYTLQLFAGKDDGSGAIDTSKPYTQKTFPVQIRNDLPPISPGLSLLSSPITNSTSIQLRASTGAVVDGRPQNCRTFSNMALVEEAFPGGGVAPVSPSSYTLDCTAGGTQDFNFTLSGSEGTRIIRLWSIDASGNISLTATQVSLIYDNTSPALSLNSLNGGQSFRGGSSVDIEWSSSDLNLETTPISLSYSVDSGGTWTSIASNLSNSGSFSWSLPSINDGNVRVRVQSVDKAGNQSTVTSTADFNIDSAPPSAPSVSLASSTPSNNRTANLSIVCDGDYAKILLSQSSSQPSSSATGWVDCSASTTYEVSSGDGLKTIYVWSKDAVGNVSASSNSVSFTLDQTPPSLTFSSPAADFATTSDISLAGTCESGLTISITGDTLTTSTSCNSSSFSQTLALTGGDGSKTISLSQTDAAGNSETINRSFIKDTTPPTLQSISLNNGDSSTGNRNILADFSIQSSRSDIHSFCLKLNDSSDPLVGDGCWRNLSSIGESISAAVSINDFPFAVGAILGTYTVRIWAKDELGNISTYSDTSNVDVDSIFYSPDLPPTISGLTAVSSDTPNDPLTSADTTILFGSDIFVKWTVSDNNAIPAGKITLSYSTDETNFTTLATGLNNGVNGACTLSGTETGCALIVAASPTSGYYKVKIEVEDSGQNKSLSTSNPINTGNFQLLSGNTSLGLGGSGATAVLLGRDEFQYADNSDIGAFVVTKKGYIFFNYKDKGLTVISPETGQITQLIPQTGTSSGDGGNASSATLQGLRRILLDHDENLLLLDYKTIRKVDLSATPWTISKLVGGGSDPADGAAALSAQLPLLNTSDLFTTTPDGKIYFQKGKELWFFDPVDQKVHKKLTVSGLGANMSGSFNASYDSSYCNNRSFGIAYDKSTSAITTLLNHGQSTTEAACGSKSLGTSWGDIAIQHNVTTGVAQTPHPPVVTWSSSKFTGLDGRLYVLEHGRRQLLRYEPDTNTYSAVITGSAVGRCADDTLATECPAIVMDAFVNEFGKVYFLDMGVIRTIDDEGKVQTLAGQPRNYGVGQNPMSARFSQINFFSVDGDDVYVANKLENQIVKFNLTGGNLEHVAGNSTANGPVDNQLATEGGLLNCSWAMPCGFIVDGVLNRLYYRVWNEFSYIDLATGRWVTTGPEIQGDSRLSYLGQSPTKLLAYTPTHHGSSGDRATLRELDSSGNDLIVYGKDEIIQDLATDLCVDDLGTNCTIDHTMGISVQTQAKYDSTTDSWAISYFDRFKINWLPQGGGTTTRLTETVNRVSAFDIRRDGDLLVYYCSTNGKLYSRNTNTSVETELTLPSPTMRCDGQALHYHSGRNSLLFIFKQNSLFGIGEYKL